MNDCPDWMKGEPPRNGVWYLIRQVIPTNCDGGIERLYIARWLVDRWETREGALGFTPDEYMRIRR